MANLQSRIDGYLGAAVAKGFAGSVLVARKNEVVFSAGYGLADRDKAIPVTPSTVFNIGELTRHFTIAAVLKLAEGRSLRLDDPLSRFIPDAPPDKALITVEQLLRHAGGISPHAGNYRYDFAPRRQFLNELFRAPLASAPGSREEYANAGYILLAAIVELAAGESFESFLRAALLEPAGMRHTGYQLPDWDPAQLAHSYFYDIHAEDWVDWGTTPDQFGVQGVSWYTLGKGDLQSSAEDLLAWHRALDAGALLSPRSRELLERYLRHEQPPDTSDHVEASNGHYQAEYIRDPADELLVISLNSLDRDVPVGRHVARMAAEADFQPPPFPADPYELLFAFMREHSPAQAGELHAWFEAHRHSGMEDPGLLYPVGIMQMNKGRHEWAVALLALSVSLFPHEGNFWDSLGEAYLAGGQRERAVESFREAQKRMPPGDCFWCLNTQDRLAELGGL